MCVQGDLKAVIWLGPRVVEELLISYNDVYGGFEQLRKSGAGSAEKPGILQRHAQGYFDASLPPYIVSLSSPKPPDQSGHCSAVAVYRLSKPHA